MRRKRIKDIDIITAVSTTGVNDREKITILNSDGVWQEEINATMTLSDYNIIESMDTLNAIFLPGQSFNAKMKQLAGDSQASYTYPNTTIKHIKRSVVEPGSENKQSNNIVSASNSEVPIYIWFDTDTIYWWSEDVKPNMNQNAESMFSRLTELKDIDLRNIKTNYTTNMHEMFYDNQKLEKLDLSRFDTSNVTDMGGMFRSNASLISLNISSFNTSKVTDMSFMLAGLSSLESLNLLNFNTQNVTNMMAMFGASISLKTLNLSSFDTSKVTNMNSMFFRCTGARHIVKSHNLNGHGRSCFVYPFTLVVNQCADFAGSKAGNDAVSDMKCAVLQQYGSQRPSGFVQFCFNNDASSETVRVCLQLEHIRLQQDHLKQFIHTLTGDG